MKIPLDNLWDRSLNIRESVAAFIRLPPTTHVKEIPVVIHEPAIFSGYRKINQPWRYYFFSLFQIHNETVNVWTHLVGFVILWIVLGNYSEVYDIWTDTGLLPLLIFGVCCMITCLCSSVVHLLHSKSSTVHYNAFLIDYIGSTSYAFGTGIMTFFSNSEERVYTYLETSYMPLLVATTWGTYTCLSFAKILYGEDPYNTNKKILQVGSMAVQAVVVTVPFGPRYWYCYWDEMCSFSSLNHLTLCYILFILQAFFFGSHFPEKLCPGRFDILGHGHQIFHLLVTSNQLAQFWAILIDYENDMVKHTKPDIVTLVSYAILLLVCEIMTLLIVRKFIPKETQKDN